MSGLQRDRPASRAHAVGRQVEGRGVASGLRGPEPFWRVRRAGHEPLPGDIPALPADGAVRSPIEGDVLIRASALDAACASRRPRLELTIALDVEPGPGGRRLEAPFR